MVSPDLLNAYAVASASEIPFWNWFGLQVQSIGYQGTVLPVLAVSWILANLEKRLHKITPSWLDNLTTPLLSVLLTAVVTFVFVGPVLRTAGDMLAFGLSWLYNTLGFLGGAIFGLLYSPIVITGMHHSFTAIETQLIAAAETTGGSFIFPIASMNNVAQGAAVLAVLFTSKNEKMKSLCSASGVSALLGITEPAMFGVTLKLKYPFYAAMAGCAVGSAWIAGTKTLALAMGAAGIPGFISIDPANWGNFFIGIVLSMSVSFAGTWVLAKREAAKEASVSADNTAKTERKILFTDLPLGGVAAPFAGTIKPIEQGSDPVFASKAMGDGIVIQPEENMLYSLVNGKVVMVFPTRHAIGLQDEDGTELLIHVGMDTVSLEGKPFKVLVKDNDTIKAGQPLMEVDFQAIREAGLSTETPVVVTNGKHFALKAQGKVEAGQLMLEMQ